MKTHCDLCGLLLVAWTSRVAGRCAPCRKEHGTLTPEVNQFAVARAILEACGSCPSCEQGHFARCTGKTP